VDTAQLSAWFQANKTEVLMVGGAAVAGLALYKRKTGAAGAGAASGVTAGAVAPGTMPAGAVVSGGSYDSSAWSAYNSLQDEIGTLARQGEAARQTSAAGSGASSAVKAPLASSLLAPSYSGSLWHMGSGFGEFESDGSMLVYTPDQFAKATSTSGYQVTDLGTKNVPGLSWTSTTENLIARNKALTSTAQSGQTSGA
jgi:hypothetical protein